MERKALFVAGLTVITLISGCATTTTNGISVNGANDDLKEQVLVSSELFSTPYMGFPSPSDYFFEAAIAKDSGQTLYELHLQVNGNNWKRWDELKFAQNGENVVIPLEWYGTDMTCNDYGCAHIESGVATVTKSTLEFMAAQSTPITMTMQSSRAVSSMDFNVLPDEVRAFLDETQRLPL